MTVMMEQPTHSPKDPPRSPINFSGCMEKQHFIIPEIIKLLNSLKYKESQVFLLRYFTNLKVARLNWKNHCKILNILYFTQHKKVCYLI